MPFNTETVEFFLRAGVNPQSMNPDISGDTALKTLDASDYGQHMVAVIDGAWVKGFDKPEVVADIANWSSGTIANQLLHALHFNSDIYKSLGSIIHTAIPHYRRHMEELRERVGYSVTPPAPFEGIDLAKIGPQSAFAAILFNPGGDIEIAQVRDCMVVFEHADGGMWRQTPNQSEIVAEASKSLDIQHEGLGAYQARAQEIILNNQWNERRGEVKILARAAHKPAFFKLWLQAEATLPAGLSGPEGFALWRNTFDTLCLCQNSAYFLNNPEAETVLRDGAVYTASWAMFTGEESMLPLTFYRRFSAQELQEQDVTAIWIMSDGAFKQGDRGEDLQAMRKLGPEKYYEEILLNRFDNSKPGRKRYAEDRVPMDVTIIRIPL